MIDYDDLPTMPDGRHHAWDVFAGDEQGSLSRLTDDVVRAAMSEVRTGARLSLSVPLGTFNPALSRSRGDFQHSITRTRSGGDDKVDNLYLQESSQWDGFAHVRYREYGFLGGRDVDALEAGELGIDRMFPAGIVARGVLADVPALWATNGRTWHPDQRYDITPDDVEEALALQRAEVRAGDVLLVRTGWVGWYLTLGDVERKQIGGTMGTPALPTPGLRQGDAFPRWLWDRGIAAVAADNPALEAIPVPKGAGFLHRHLLPLLGIPIGELWALDELGEACAHRGAWSFLLMSVPLKIARGVGSPNNAIAVL